MVDIFQDMENNLFRSSLYDAYPFLTSLEIMR